MAYLSFDPSSKKLEDILSAAHRQIESALQDGLVRLGVAENDVVFKILRCDTVAASEPDHIEIILKTDSNRVTSAAVVKILLPFIRQPFEVTRIYVGYGLPEFFYEIAAFILRRRRNWASNYD